MQTLKIKNFGPIGENKNAVDGLFTIHISPVTVLIGETASGKSTVAKLCSIFLWLEKKCLQYDTQVNLNIETFKNLCRQQEMEDYFSSDTVLMYEGAAFIFKYIESDEIVSQKAKQDISDYELPKIQYVSAARNLLTVLYRIRSSVIASNDGDMLAFSSNIPFMVNDLNKEYIRALNNLAKQGFALPIKKARVFHHDHYTFIEAGEKKISMSSASSGIQSITPLLLVSEFLSREVKKDVFEKLQDTNEYLKNKIRNELNKTNYENLIEKFNLYCMGGRKILDHDDIDILETVIKKFIPSCFINIVEEPEQNLFPEAQADVLYTLLEYKNSSENNKLIFSTHSPYMLTALNNAIFAHEVFSKTGKISMQLDKNKMLPFEQVSAYTFKNGAVSSITNEDTHLIDAAQIDECSIKINDTFDKLLELLNE